jgi:RecA-family ATPase
MILFGVLADVVTVGGDLIMQCARDIVPERVTWVWPGVIPLGKLTIFAGDPGVGKSAVSLDVIAHVTASRTFPDGTPPLAGEAIILSAEDDPADTLRPRLEAAGADLTKAHIVEAVRINTSGQAIEKEFNLAADLPHLEAALEDNPHVKLVVVDPISGYLGTTDTNRTASMRSLVYTPLSHLASRRKVAVLAIDHFNKSDKRANKKGIYRVSGSIATVAAARAVWAFAKDKANESRRLMLPLKSNLAKDQEGFAYRIEETVLPASPEPIPTIRIGWEPSRVKANINEALSETPDEDNSALGEAIAWLKEQLAEPKSANELRSQAELDGLSWSTVKRAKGQLGVKPYTDGKHWMWPAVKKTSAEE